MRRARPREGGELKPVRAATALAAAGLLASVFGCSGGGGITATPAAPGGANATTTGVQATPAPLDDGAEYFAFVSAVDLDERTITFDVGGFVEGKRAKTVALEDGAIKEGEELDADYYVRNKVEFDRTLPLASDVEIRVVGDPPDLVKGDLEDFAEAFESDEIQPFADDGSATYRGKNGRYWVLIEDGAINKIEEQYLP